MKKILFIFCLFVTISVFSQEEKRLALVIGNANYEKGPLENPVNDANLIAKTLDSLNFEVILATNIEDKRSLENKIREFGAKRSDFDVGFVYYAGHGVQINGENYLLPTKEFFESEEDIEYNAVAVSKVMKYLKSTTDQVNILVLDACRDNPFESNWNATRSLKGQGLAKIPPPTGSLIAFSTDAGNTAADGEGINSIYTLSLTKNMLLEDTSIDQVFRNVRGEVLGKTDGKQRPIEATQLTGQTYYLNPGNFEKEFKEVENNLVNKIELKETIDILKIIIEKDSSNSKAFLYKGHTNVLLQNTDSAIEDYNRAIKLDSLNLSAYYSLVFHEDGEFSYTGIANVLKNNGDISSTNIVLDDLYKLNKNNPFYYRLKTVNSNDENDQKSLIDYSLNKISDEDIIYFYNEQTLSFNNRFNPVIDFKTIQTLRKMELFMENDKYQDAIMVKDNYLSENSNVFSNDKLLKEKTIGILSTSTLSSLHALNRYEEYEKHAREIKSFGMLEFKILGSFFLNGILVMKGEFKEGLENSKYAYEFQKNSTDIKRSVLNGLYYDSFIDLLHFTLLVYENDVKALELLNEFIIDLDKDRFKIYIEEKQAIYYYRYIVNLLLDRKEEAKKDLQVAMKMVEDNELVKKPHSIYGPNKNNEGELYADQLYEQKEKNFSLKIDFLYDKINYYYLLRNNLEYQNYLKLFNANMEYTDKKEINILNGFIINTLKYNSNNRKTYAF